MKYKEFLEKKTKYFEESGFDVSVDDLSKTLFPFQKDLVKWSIKLGKSSIFAGTGLGKTLMQADFARVVSEQENIKVLILAPLAVSKQTIRIAKEKMGIEICDMRDVGGPDGKINITNYEQLHNIDPSEFNCIILDESSILKNYSGKTRNDILEKFNRYRYRLACTATPAPNDYMELGNHSEFVGAMSRSEMLSMFFIHDGGETQTWRLKKHSSDIYWRWVSSWGAIVTKPSDLGYDDGDFLLPELDVTNIVIKSEQILEGHLFAVDARTLQERKSARRQTLNERTIVASDLVNSSKDIFIVWCNLNSESELLKRSIRDSVEVKGGDSDEHKEKSMIDFADGKIKCLITKPSICGHGMNFQVCHNQIFVGLSDSFEQYYQAIRRSWRFGQRERVAIRIITSDIEGEVLKNIRRKEKQSIEMIEGMVNHSRKYVMENIKHTRKDKIIFAKREAKIPSFLNKGETKYENCL